MSYQFQLTSDYSPAGDQPQAIEQIIGNFETGSSIQTLLGATGTGKTFTMANIIQDVQKPTLIISHNKTLAAQLATEFKHFFPKNAVHYFISYFDYYQPESYLPQQDLYIEKEATVNEEIQMYRLATLASLLTRPDVIVVASVSALYGLGQKEYFKKMSLTLEVGEEYDFPELKKQLIQMQYQPVQSKIEQGLFEWRGEMLDIYVSTEKVLYRCHFNEDKLERIEKKDALTMRDIGSVNKTIIWPATQFLQDTGDVEEILGHMHKEMQIRKKEFEQKKQLVEAQRIEKRVDYDTRMIRENGFVNGIENYSPHFDGRRPGEMPNTLFDYFPDDMLMIVDESHMTIPQFQAMPAADRRRKINLINFGFRLPSAIDHRPLRFDELSHTLGRPLPKGKSFTPEEEVDSQADIFRGEPLTQDESHMMTEKGQVKTLFVSATPAPYEMEIADDVVEQIIRPTGLLDPKTYVYPKSGDYSILLASLEKLVDKKPQVKKFLEKYTDHL